MKMGKTISVKLISKDYNERIKEIVRLAWNIFISQYTFGRLDINKEAPFQHHLATILKEVGGLYTLNKTEIFFVDLETKCENIKGKNKYIDITFGFRGDIKCSMELKFKTKRQGAQTYGRIDAYLDLEALELSQQCGYDLGFFFMITDDPSYIDHSKSGIGALFPLHDGARIVPKEYLSKGKRVVDITLKNEYLVNWEKHEDLYFLRLDAGKIARL